MDIPLAPILFDMLGKYLGQPLTAEVASRFAGELLAKCYPGPIDTSGIEPQVRGTYVIRCAPVGETLPKLRHLHEAHWKETEGHRHGIAFAPDYERARLLDLSGRSLLVVAEVQETGELVGNFSMYLSKSMHTQTLMATEDTLFVAPAHRKAGLGIAVIRYAERAAAHVGAEELNVSVKLVNEVGAMIQRMGYQAVGTQFTKILKEAPYVRS